MCVVPQPLGRLSGEDKAVGRLCTGRSWWDRSAPDRRGDAPRKDAQREFL